MLKLYLLTQKENIDFDTFDSCVVAAYSKEDAVMIHPFLYRFGEYSLDYDVEDYYKYDKDPNYIYELVWKPDRLHSLSWASCPENVDCVFIGIAAEDIKPNSVVCSSYNAG